MVAILSAVGAMELMVVAVTCCTERELIGCSLDQHPFKVSPAKVGVDAWAISCGRDKVISPTFADGYLIGCSG